MKARYKVSKDPRPIELIDAIKIDWEGAIKEAELYIKKAEKLSFEATLEGYKIMLNIKRMSRSDSIDEYLEFIEKYRFKMHGG